MLNKYIDQIFKMDVEFHAHSKEGSSNELLLDHLKLTYEYYEKMENNKNLEKIVKSIIKSIYKDSSKFVEDYSYKLFKAAVFYHDIGKINPKFQQKLNNNINYENDYGTSRHAIYSSNIYLDGYLKELQEMKKVSESLSNKDFKFLIYLIYSFSYIMSRHHSGLTGISDYVNNLTTASLKSLYKNNFSEISLNNNLSDNKLDDMLKSLNLNGEGIYILNKLLFSVLVTSDYYATYEFMNSENVLFEVLKNKELFKKYTSSKLYNDINDYKAGKLKIEGINKLRTDMFIESETNILNNLDKNIFYLEAPTGAGKTNMSINLANLLYNNLDEITSINYIFPFNTLIEQTSNTFEEYFKKYKEYVVVNSITPMINDDNDENLNYEMAYIQSAFCHYPIKITSHVNFFDTIFGVSKSSNYTLYNYINSIVIIDEIQSYSNEIWRHIIKMLDKYASLLNIKFIIMSATLPKLDIMLDSSDALYCKLINDANKYYNNPLFKNRVKLNFDLLKKKIELLELKNEVLKHKGRKILIEFIKKQTARDFFNLLYEEGLNVYELTGDDNNYTRKNIINKIKEENDIIIVATQTIEAGVDIDMDIGFKDISILDSEEQFLGRINRSCKKENCIAYFFNFDDAKDIYKKDYRLEFNLLDMDNRNILNDKNFSDYYIKVMEKIKRETDKLNSKNINSLYNWCSKLMYKEVEDKMKLIKIQNKQIFLNFDIEVDGEILKGKDVWEEYKNICLNNELTYAKKSIKLSKIKEKLNLFIYNILIDSDKLVRQDEKFGSIYYIENGNEFITNGKFDRKKYQDVSGGLIL